MRSATTQGSQKPDVKKLKKRMLRYREGEKLYLNNSKDFLILMQPEAPETMEPVERGHYTTDAPIRGIVRKVTLKQVGHFMMGVARIKSYSITISGAYGDSGLPCTVPPEVYNQGVDLPTELVEAWNKGGGWNGVGSEASAMKEWALRTLLDRSKKGVQNVRRA